MPFYEYECSNCKFYVEALQKISDEPLKQCPSCKKQTLKKLVSAPVFRLKGGGWYETDFKSDKEEQAQSRGRRGGSRGQGAARGQGGRDEGGSEGPRRNPPRRRRARARPRKGGAKAASKPKAKAHAKPAAKAKPKAKPAAKKKKSRYDRARWVLAAGSGQMKRSQLAVRSFGGSLSRCLDSGQSRPRSPVDLRTVSRCA